MNKHDAQAARASARTLPISFSPPMVRAIKREIETPGTGKTQTRRVLDAACDEPPAFVADGAVMALDENERPYRWPRTYAVGDLLYVREHWRTDRCLDHKAPRDMPHSGGDWVSVRYEADGYGPGVLDPGRFRQGMHMPRWASRFTLLVTDVRVQRLQEISEADAMAEGLHRYNFASHTAKEMGCDWTYGTETRCGSPISAFASLWDSLNAQRGYGWEANPWVVAYTFRPMLGNVDTVALSDAPHL